MAGKDFYRTLGVSKTASDKEIRSAYRRLARKYHPDVNAKDAAGEEKFKEINEAHQVLSDADKRKKYDTFGDQWERADQMSQAGRAGGSGSAWSYRRGGSTAGQSGSGQFGFGDVSFGDFDLGGIFGRGGNPFGGGRGRARRGEDVEHPVQISLEEAYLGATRTVQMETDEVCGPCGGAGVTGREPCAGCGGKGVIPRLRRLEVKIPAGVKDGSRVRIAGEGGASTGGAPRGDLYLLISVRLHQVFERRDDDVYVDVEVPLTVAVLGGEAEVPTLRGTKVMLKIPAETQNGATFRLGGLGIPNLGGSGKGDLYARVKVTLPTKLTARQKELFEELHGTLTEADATA